MSETTTKRPNDKVDTNENEINFKKAKKQVIDDKNANDQSTPSDLPCNDHKNDKVKLDEHLENEETVLQLQLMNEKEIAEEAEEERKAIEIKNECNRLDNAEDDHHESDDANDEQQTKDKKDEKKPKHKFGIIYLTQIPPGRNYTRLRDIFSTYGEVGNIFLVPDKAANDRLEKRGKPFKCYAEGFVEFKKKKVAKMVAELLNGQPVDKSKNGVKGFIWDIRYLHRVKWHHLMAKMKHAKALEEQRVRFETEKAKDTADHYLEMMNEWKRRERNQDFVSKDSAKRIEQLVNKQRPTKKEFFELREKLQKEREEKDMSNLYDTLFS